MCCALPDHGHVKLMGICVSVCVCVMHSSAVTARGRGDCMYMSHQISVPPLMERECVNRGTFLVNQDF